MRLLPSLAILFGMVWSASAAAANIDLAQTEFNKPLRGVMVEGEIEPGDTTKLMTKLLEYAFIYQPDVPRIVFLRSKGGNVLEAMKMGALIRRLRLVTAAPTKIEGHTDIFCTVFVSDRGNCICASACFLAYVGGIERSGNLVALHRPSLPKDEAHKISDLEYEVLEKGIIEKTTGYLRDMEVDQFFIDKMMSTSSQDAYVLKLWETDKYHLSSIVPSIEEIVLAKCKVLTSQEEKMLDTVSGATPQGKQLREQLVAKLKLSYDCKEKAMDELRSAAFEREIHKHP